MARYVYLALVVYIAAVAQTALAPVLAVRGVMPQLLLVVVLLGMVCLRARWGAMALALVGLAGDLTGGGLLGPGVALLVLMGLLIERMGREVELSSPLAFVPLLIAASFVFAFSHATSGILSGATAAEWRVFVVSIFVSTAYTVVVGIVAWIAFTLWPRTRVGRHTWSRHLGPV